MFLLLNFTKKKKKSQTKPISEMVKCSEAIRSRTRTNNHTGTNKSQEEEINSPSVGAQRNSQVIVVSSNIYTQFSIQIKH